MKIAVSSKGKDLESEVDSVFGRCAYFIIVEIEEGKRKIEGFEAVENEGAGQMGGAGIRAARQVVEKGAKAVISGNIGPRASDVLKQFNVKTYSAAGLVREAVQKFIEGKLEKM